MEWKNVKVLWVGIGCGRGTARQLIETAIQQVCLKHQISEDAIAGIATIDTKALEVGLVELCRDRHWSLRTFSADVLRTVFVPNPSHVVNTQVRTPSVAEAAAIQAAGGETMAESPLKVAKQIFRLQGHPGAVTVAIAQAQQ